MDEKSIYWLLQFKSDLPNHQEWLSTQEQTIAEQMKFPARREDWKLGRWTAKRLVHSYLKKTDAREYQLTDLKILPDDDGSPRVFLRKKAPPIKISISHRGDAGFCALNPGNSSIGCDLEIIEERSDAFVSDYFTFEEKLKVIMAAEEEEAIVANLIWSAKESVLKVLRTGLNVDTRSISIDLNNIAMKEGWNEIRAKSLEFNQDFWGWWQVKDEFVLTILSDQPIKMPQRI